MPIRKIIVSIATSADGYINCRRDGNVVSGTCSKRYIKDQAGNAATCCSDVIVAPATSADLGLFCDIKQNPTSTSTLTALTVDQKRGTYNENPFLVQVKITNTGSRPADNVKVVVLPQSSELKVVGDPERLAAIRLDPGISTDTLNWQMYAYPRTQSGDIVIDFVVTADGLTSVLCQKSIYVPEVGRPALDCKPTTSSMTKTGDTLYFNYALGDYRDDNNTMSSNNSRGIFTITAHVKNTGQAQATNTQAVLLNSDLSLDLGETAIELSRKPPPRGAWLAVVIVTPASDERQMPVRDSPSPKKT